MQFKYLPKKWNGHPVVSFATVQPLLDEFPYAGIAILQTGPTMFDVVRLNAISMDPDARWMGGLDGRFNLTWFKAQARFVELLAGANARRCEDY